MNDFEDAISPIIQFRDDFELDKETNTLKLKPTASKEAIQFHLRYPITKEENGDVVYNPAKLSALMIEEFKKLDLYQLKTEEERQEIEQYLKDNPDIEDPNPDIISIV